MRFSLLVPTRERPELIKYFFGTIVDTTSNLGEIEVLIAYDEDDLITVRALDEIRNIYKFNISYRPFPRQDGTTPYFNELAKDAKGEFLMAMNDDAEFVTKGWDDICYTRLKEFLKDRPDGAVVGVVNNNYVLSQEMVRHYKGNFSCFPIVSVKSVKYLGWMFNPEIKTWGNDINIFVIHHGCERVCWIPEVTIEHNSFHTGRRERDEVSKRIEEIFRKGSISASEFKVPENTKRLKEVIECNQK